MAVHSRRKIAILALQVRLAESWLRFQSSDAPVAVSGVSLIRGDELDSTALIRSSRGNGFRKSVSERAIMTIISAIREESITASRTSRGGVVWQRMF